MTSTSSVGAVHPRPGPAPPGSWTLIPGSLAVALALALPAVLAPGGGLPGDGGSPELFASVNRFWLFGVHGWRAFLDTRLQYWPQGCQILVLDPPPVDAALAWPLTNGAGPVVAYGIFLVLVLWANGVALSWLAARWWRSLPAGIVAGFCWQVSAWVLQAAAGGTTYRLLAAALASTSLLLLVPAVTERRCGQAVGAGLLAGLAFLSSPAVGWYHLVAVLVLVLLAAAEGLGPPVVPFLAGLLGVAVAPTTLRFGLFDIAWGDAPGLWSVVVRGDQQTSLAAYLNERADHSWGDVVHAPVGFGILVLAGLALAGTPRRRWLGPLAWVVLGAWTSLGIWVDLGGVAIPTPLAVIVQAPAAIRPLDPVQALFLVALGSTLLAAGGASWLGQRLRRPWLVALAVTAVVGIEATATLPWVPLPAASPTSAVAACTEGREGPLLQLPMEPMGAPLLGQVHHGRPLVNGRWPSDDRPAPLAADLTRERDAVANLLACEWDRGWMVDPATGAAVRDELARMGVEEVVVDTSPLALPGSVREGYLACIRRILGLPAFTADTCETYATVEGGRP